MPSSKNWLLVKKAIHLALNDRESLMDCYPPGDPHREGIQKEIDALRALSGKSARGLVSTDMMAIYLALRYAEQWEDSLADAQPGDSYGVKSRKNAKAFRGLRHELFGLDPIEQAMRDAKTVSITDLLARRPQGQPK